VKNEKWRDFFSWMAKHAPRNVFKMPMSAIFDHDILRIMGAHIIKLWFLPDNPNHRPKKTDAEQDLYFEMHRRYIRSGDRRSTIPHGINII
jgi:hypothetical protein